MKGNFVATMAMIAWSLFVASGAMAEGGYSLVSEEEYLQSASVSEEDEIIERAVPDPMAPIIGVIRPQGGNKFRGPIDIELKFEAQGDSEIDLATLKITYGAFGIDVTDRVTEHATVTAAGLLSEDAELPKGKHKLTVIVADNEGRVGKKRFKFRIIE